MGWRFRKSFSPLPGVRITLSPRGLSTSVGAGPLRLTVGKDGAAVTARVPGTGLAYGHSIRRSGQSPGGDTSLPAATILDEPPIYTVHGEIRSADTSELTSEGLSKFRNLLAQAQEERRALLSELQAAVDEVVRFARRQRFWETVWFLPWLFPGQYGRVQELTKDAKARLDELQEQERLSRVQTQIDLPAKVCQVYAQLVEAFAMVAKCDSKWDTVSRVAADRKRERTAASHSVDRIPVSFNVASCDLIESEWRVPHLSNANGGDLYIYPGFVLLHASADAFALVEASEVKIEGEVSAFIEEEAVPGDTRILEHTWKKSNKDGSRDRRFANNLQIPVVEYGRMTITSPSGLNEEYLVSNFRAVAHFVSAWNEFRNVVVVSTI